MEDPENNRLRARLWAQNNVERNRERARKWALEHPDQYRENMHRAYLRTKGERAQAAVAYRREHAVEIKEYKRAWLSRNLDKHNIASARRRARKRNAQGTFTTEQFRDLCAKYGNVCLACGQAGPLVPDHVIPLSRGGSNGIENIQPLCRTCNGKKWAKDTDYRFSISVN